MRIISSAGPNLGAEILDQLQEYHKTLLDVLGDISFESQSAIKSLTDIWQQMIDAEKTPSPLAAAINKLHLKVPEILIFDDESRRLNASYQLSELKSGLPHALQSLFTLAGFDLPAEIAAFETKNSARLTTLEHRANRMLEKSFSEAWRQSGIHVALRFTPEAIEIQIVNEKLEFTPFAERSDGLRQFVALYCFVLSKRAIKPILLIDEADQRLHYDAQADLVQMLVRQNVASKVIYTTHSAGCLPEDLGHGVRLIRQLDNDPTKSVIQNKFWAEKGGGFSPLLYGLGATTLAFFPTRHAVCVEGPSDMLLYPTMFRQVLNVDSLGFQIVPNLSSAASELLPLKPSDRSPIAFLVDGDNGGRKIAEALVTNGIPPGCVTILRDEEDNGLEIEDFIKADILVRAANNLIAKHSPASARIDAGGAPRVFRMEWLEDCYFACTGKSCQKVDLAYEILDFLDDDPSLNIIDLEREDLLRKIALAVSQSTKVRN